MPEIETTEIETSSKNIEIGKSVRGFGASLFGTRLTAQKYHASPAFTQDMSAAFKKAAQQAQIENAQLDETP